jgi:hypothetical protein
MMAFLEATGLRMVGFSTLIGVFTSVFERNETIVVKKKEEGTESYYANFCPVFNGPP